MQSSRRSALITQSSECIKHIDTAAKVAKVAWCGRTADWPHDARSLKLSASCLWDILVKGKICKQSLSSYWNCTGVTAKWLMTSCITEVWLERAFPSTALSEDTQTSLFCDLNASFESKPNLPTALWGRCDPVLCRELCWLQSFAVTAAQFNPSYHIPVESVPEAVMAVVAAAQKNSHGFFHENVFLCVRKRKNWVGIFGPPEVSPLSLLLFFDACNVCFGNVSVRKTTLIPPARLQGWEKKKKFCLLCSQYENVPFSS